jgi:hypothetical protein
MDFVQTTFTDTPGPLYPGQIADSGTYSTNEEIRSYRTETVLYVGRGVVKGTANAQNDSILTPYGVKTPLAGSVLADIVGIAVRLSSVGADANGVATSNRATQMWPIAETGSKAHIAAEVPAAITIADGDAVYMSVSHVSIPVGAFSNAAATGMVGPIVGAKWVGAAAATTIGRIEI